MCLICKNGDYLNFLQEWRNTVKQLKKLEMIMLCYGKKHKEYDAYHKKLVRIRKDFCRLENEREPYKEIKDTRN